MSTLGLLLVAHGSKDPEWVAPFHAIEAAARDEFSGPTALAYLESASPRVELGIEQLRSHGVTHVTVAPLFFATGSHVRVDIPELIRQAGAQHPEMTFHILPPVGQLPVVQKLISSEIAAQATKQAIPRLEHVSDDVSIAAQISVRHVQRAAEEGYRSIICNRPDEEEGEKQTPHLAIAKACEKHGLMFAYFPVSPSDHTEQQARGMRDCLSALPKPVLVYCRSGRRSKNLLALGSALVDADSPKGLGHP